MTDTRRPPACHHDTELGHRVTKEHRDDCEDPSTHNGCVPCTAPHCVLCRRNHATNDHPLTCPECIGKVRADLDDIRHLCRHLRWQAARGGRDGRLVAAAPIPGGDAMVLLARAGADADDLITSFGPIKGNPKANLLDEDHHPTDLVPPLLPLAGWDYQWRHHLGHHPPTKPSITGITHYLTDHLTTMAQAVDGPDWVRFADDIAALRRQLEGVLHDEREPERGIGCFECGQQLVRKFGDPKPCRHVSQARRAGLTVTQWVYTLSTYPELDDDHTRCVDQGGIADPSIGQSWECTGCRKAYTPGEYANAVRAHLLKGGPDGDGWTHITMAAEAATTQTGMAFPPNTVRRWMDRGKVGSICRWTRGVTWGQRLVFWPDVADEAAASVVRQHEAEQKRLQRERQKTQLATAMAAGEALDRAASRLGIHPARVEVFLAEWAAAQRQTAS